MPQYRSRAGFTLLELAVAIAVGLLLLTLGVPPLLRTASGLRLHLAAAELTTVLRQARMAAVRYGTNVAVKFRPEPGGGATYTLYRDMDGDGVLNRDIDRGVDLPLGPPRDLRHLGRGTAFGFPDEPHLRDPGGHPIGRREDPIRFNRSDLASFDPLGTATPGSLYLTDGRGRLTVVRVLGRTGKIRTLRWDSSMRGWRE